MNRQEYQTLIFILIQKIRGSLCAEHLDGVLQAYEPAIHTFSEDDLWRVAEAKRQKIIEFEQRIYH